MGINNWYPSDKKELNNLLEDFLSQKNNIISSKVHGIIVPHAGYAYSGRVAAKAYALLKQMKPKRAIILAPSHYIPLHGARIHNHRSWQTPLGKIKVLNEFNFESLDFSNEHAIGNQMPFLQKIGVKEILPIMIGQLSSNEAKEIAEKISSFEGIFIISSDLSHFLPYEEAVKKDKATINAIVSLNSKKLWSIDNSACGIFPLLILIELCRIKGWKPKLLEYENSGDVTGDKDSVVGYSSWVF